MIFYRNPDHYQLSVKKVFSDKKLQTASLVTHKSYNSIDWHKKYCQQLDRYSDIPKIWSVFYRLLS